MNTFLFHMELCLHLLETFKSLKRYWYTVVLITINQKSAPIHKFNCNGNIVLKLCNNYLSRRISSHRPFIGPSALSNNIHCSLGMLMSSKFMQNAIMANTESSRDTEKYTQIKQSKSLCNQLKHHKKYIAPHLSIGSYAFLRIQITKLERSSLILQLVIDLIYFLSI